MQSAWFSKRGIMFWSKFDIAKKYFLKNPPKTRCHHFYRLCTNWAVARVKRFRSKYPHKQGFPPIKKTMLWMDSLYMERLHTYIYTLVFQRKWPLCKSPQNLKRKKKQHLKWTESKISYQFNRLNQDWIFYF